MSFCQAKEADGVSSIGDKKKVQGGAPPANIILNVGAKRCRFAAIVLPSSTSPCAEVFQEANGGLAVSPGNTRSHTARSGQEPHTLQEGPKVSGFSFAGAEAVQVGDGCRVDDRHHRASLLSQVGEGFISISPSWRWVSGSSAAISCGVTSTTPAARGHGEHPYVCTFLCPLVVILWSSDFDGDDVLVLPYT